MASIKTPIITFTQISLILLMACQQSSKHETQTDQRSDEQYIVDSLTLKSTIFQNTRKIRVLLPPNYFKQNITYPVLYLNDGVMVFHMYDILNRTHTLINSGEIEPLIIVGIDNGASTQESTNPVRDRANEYLPWTDSLDIAANRVDSPMGAKYPQFLFEEVVPLINRNFRTDTQRKIGLGGVSRGALIALYTHLENPDRIENLLLESPSLYVKDQKIIKQASSQKFWPKRTYIGIGTAEGETKEIQHMALDDARRLCALINTVSQQDASLYCFEDEGATHEFEHFAKRYPAALKYLYANWER